MPQDSAVHSASLSVCPRSLLGIPSVLSPSLAHSMDVASTVDTKRDGTNGGDRKCACGGGEEELVWALSASLRSRASELAPSGHSGARYTVWVCRQTGEGYINLAESDG
ncbi:hypothetical protein EXIGLDRAFT_692943, partial [Exidia glandulosa HHB12029]